MEEPGGLQSMGSLRVGHNWTTSLSLFTFMHWRRKWQPTPVFLPGESQGRGSLVGCHLWVAQSQTRLKRLSSSSMCICVYIYIYIFFFNVLKENMRAGLMQGNLNIPLSELWPMIMWFLGSWLLIVALLQEIFQWNFHSQSFTKQCFTGLIILV